MFLERYLQLEQLRHQNIFEFSITIAKDVDEDYETLPPMIVQPIAENAIKHGILPKNTQGRVEIHFSLETNSGKEILTCTIDDDGVGITNKVGQKDIQNAGDLVPMANSAHNSLATEITQMRLQLLSNDKEANNKYAITYTSKKEASLGEGTRVKIIFG